MAARRGSTFLKSGMPLVVFIVGGSYVLSQFVQGRVEVKDMRRRSQSLREFDLEEEHRRISHEFQGDFELKRIPRPDEGGET